jgi:hypothetical protein
MRQTKITAKILAAALALGVCGVCGIADAKSAATGTKHSGVHGVILSVQKDSSQITVRTGSAKKGGLQTLHITIGAGVTIQGKNNSSGSFATLHAGDKIIIEPDTSNPTTIVDMGAGTKKAHAKKK